MASCGWRRKGKFTLICIILQIVFLVLFGLFVKYSPSATARGHSSGSKHGDTGSHDIAKYYPMFQDVHVMMFVGFGFLMTFLKRYGFGSVGLNMFVASLVIQWATLVSGFLHLHDGHIEIGIVQLLYSDFAAATVLISFGAMLGKTSPTQLVVMAMFEIAVFSVNEWIGLQFFQAVDVGGSMFVHVFGAYFGLAVSRVLRTDKWHQARSKEESVYQSDLFAMIGTIFLWMYWPSFNSAVAAEGDAQQRAVINTYFALAACVVTSFAISSLVEHNKFEMVHIQNSTLAGGVAVGTVADMQIEIWGAMLIGCVAGTVSVLGYTYLTPILTKRLKVHDTCGVNNLHGMPGLLAGLGGIFASLLATEKIYGNSLYQIFPARAPLENTTALADIQSEMPSIEPGLGRAAFTQASYQAAALGTTILMAVVGGAITGLILKIPIWDPLSTDEIYDDENFWHIPTEGFPGKPLDKIAVLDNDVEKYEVSEVEVTKV